MRGEPTSSARAQWRRPKSWSAALSWRLPRAWRWFAASLLVVGLAAGVSMLRDPDDAGLLLFMLFCMPANSLVAVPHEPGLLYFATYYPPLAIAIAGAAGAGVVAFADYDLVARVVHHPRVAGVRGTRAYRWAVRRFAELPFAVVLLFSLLPLPIMAVRLLAPASGYPAERYALAVFLGRMPRFYAVAVLGRAIALPVWAIAALFGAMVGGAYVAGRLARRSG
jgi:ribonucleoside-triphosphate reductase